MEIFRNIRFVILIFLLFTSLYLLIPPFLFKKSGVVVVSLSKNSKCSNVREGSLVTQIALQPIKNSKDYQNIVKRVKANEYVAMIVDGVPGGCVALSDGNLGIEVKDVPTKKLKFGLDIQGGTSTEFKPEEKISEDQLKGIVEILDKRVSVLGLPETKINYSDNSIKITSLEEDISPLIKKCEFKAKIVQKLELENKTATLRLGKEYKLQLLDSGIKVNDFYSNKSFIVENISFEIENRTNESISISSTIISNKDVLNVLTQFSSIKYEPNFRTYTLTIPLEVSPQVQERFRKIARNIPTVFTGRELMLDAKLVYSLDGKRISSLSIPKRFVEERLETISIIAFGGESELERNKRTLESCLLSGMLPVELKKIESKYVEPKYKNLLSQASLIACVILSIPFLLGVVKFKNLGLGLWSSFLLTSEIVVVLGIASLTQRLLIYGWVLDIQSIIGLFTFLLFSLVGKMEVFFKKKIMSKFKINIFILLFSFVLLFTAWKGFGLALLSGSIISWFLTKPLLSRIFST